MTDSSNLDFTVPDPWGDLPGYALNALSDEERARVEELLETSAEAREQLRLYMEAAENLGRFEDELEPPARVRRTLMAQVDSDLHLMDVALEDARSVLPPRKPVFSTLLQPVRVAYLGVAAAMVAVLAVAVVLGAENAQLNSEMSQLRDEVETEHATMAELAASVEHITTQFSAQDAEVARLTKVNAGLNEALKDLQWLTYVTQNREYRVPNYLEGSSEAPEANGTLAVKNFDDLAVLLVSNLPEAPTGYRYTLSLVENGVRDPVAMFQVNEAGMARVEFELPDNFSFYDSAIVTLDPVYEDGGALSGPAVLTASETR